MNSTPLQVVIEYTADPVTREIVDGPVELSDLHFDMHLDVFRPEFSLTFQTDIEVVLSTPGHGTLAGDTITRDNDVPMQDSTTGMTDCLGDSFWCGVSTPWPHIEDPTPADQPLPTFTVFSDSEFADRFISDNGTPSWTHDIVVAQGPDKTVWNTWEGAQQSRVFVPEPTSLLLLAFGLAGLAVRRRWDGSQGPRD